MTPHPPLRPASVYPLPLLRGEDRTKGGGKEPTKVIKGGGQKPKEKARNQKRGPEIKGEGQKPKEKARKKRRGPVTKGEGQE